MNEKRQATMISLAVFAVVAYLLFLTYQSVLSNYNTDKKISNLEDEISLLDIEKQYLADLNLYYATDTYKELEARRKLGMKKKGETVVKIPISQDRIEQYEKNLTTPDVSTDSKPSSLTDEESNSRKWIRFIFKI